ncbi:MAG: glycosyltransferase family 4 protein [Paludibacteraceae bacterium]|nr:glycosyltransferase family 4 protein [Paludibacteraceae bacterium]
MKILLCNKFYYRRGGDCIYTFNVADLLRQQGHEVAFFSMQYPENDKSPWSLFFPSEVNFKPGLGMIEAFMRPFGTGEVKRKFVDILDFFKPDVVHLNNIHSQISPVIAEIAHNRGIKIVWTIHDCKLVCPRYDCERDNKRCEECFVDLSSCLKHKCMKGSLLASFIGYCEAKKWNPSRLQKCTDTFIAPSDYMRQTMVRGHYDPSKIETLCNFIDVKKVANADFKKEDYYCFLGAIRAIKGVRTLCKAASQLPYKLILIGGGELLEELKELYKESKNIVFVGQKSWNELRPIIEHARFSVLPSECAENNPLSIIEAQSLGTPVLGAKRGGIPELIETGVSGMLFESANVDDLKEKINMMFKHDFDYKAISSNAIKMYNDQTYYEQLMAIYKS